MALRGRARPSWYFGETCTQERDHTATSLPAAVANDNASSALGSRASVLTVARHPGHGCRVSDGGEGSDAPEPLLGPLHQILVRRGEVFPVDVVAVLTAVQRDCAVGV